MCVGGCVGVYVCVSMFPSVCVCVCVCFCERVPAKPPVAL